MVAWGCSQCRGPEYEKEDINREARNCDGRGGRLYFDFDPELERCPNRSFDDETWWWLVCWQDFEMWQLLPFGGSDLMKEPLFVYEAFRLMTQTRIQVENEAVKREQARQEREQRKWQKKQR